MNPDAYATVQVRDRFRCLRCGGMGANWHHRRSKSIRDQHTDCPCNGVWLCGSGSMGCHGWVHSHPLLARQQGWIVSRYMAEPSMVPVMSRVHGGVVLLDCEGDTTPVDTREME